MTDLMLFRAYGRLTDFVPDPMLRMDVHHLFDLIQWQKKRIKELEDGE